MDSIYLFLATCHSFFRWFVLILLLVAVVRAVMGWNDSSKPYTEGNRKFNAMTLGVVHTQVLLGVILLLISPKVVFSGEMMKDPVLRYFAVEHPTMMLLSAVLLTVGFSKHKRLTNGFEKHKTIAIFYTIGFVLIMISLLSAPIKMF